MRMITGYLPPTSGEVVINGISLHDNPIDAKRQIGYLPELPPLYPELTVSDYLDFVAQLKQVPSKQRKAAVDSAIERAALTDVRRRIIGRLSKGYRQRVGIAQAIVNEPPLLILDEPTAGLDPRQILETRQLIKRLAGQHTVILSTHILSEAQNTCERVIIINKGKLVAVDTPNNLTHRLKTTQTLQLEVRGPADAVRRAVAGVPGVERVEVAAQQDSFGRFNVETSAADVREAVARTVVTSGWGLIELKTHDLSLEEIFLSLTAVEKPVAQERQAAQAS
jgi:ABC-2 type transport system ATP-binding protein